MADFRLALAQINCIVGDIDANRAKIRAALAESKKLGADLVAFPELALSGYPPEDLVFKKSFLDKNQEGLQALIAESRGINAIIGFLDNDGANVYNAAAVLSHGRLAGVYHKICLPNYGVFDEKRYFREGRRGLVLAIGQTRVGICICEDLWLPNGPVETLVREGGAQLVVAINASPYHMGKWKMRREIIRRCAGKHAVIVAYNNLVGGQDELIFDGHSLVYDRQGNLLARGRQFQEDLLVLDIAAKKLKPRAHTPAAPASGQVKVIQLPSGPDKNRSAIPLPATPPPEPLSPLAEVYQALTLGIRDYTAKNGFRRVLIGLSGGIDSALTLALAVDALGAQNVKAIFMPSPYTSEASIRDSRRLAQNLGVSLWEIPIQHLFDAYLQELAPYFQGHPPGIAEENLQARIRGNLLMALSNKFGWLVLTTGNKSEMSVGYATLYGDMAGGFAVIKDVFKTLVYELAHYRNSLGKTPVIPRNIIDREPTAELAAGQKDSDSLPPYELLDPILKAYVQEEKGIEEIIAMGFDAQTVKKVIRMVERSEYKRRQAPIGIKITPKAFGKDRRLPITNRFQP